MNIDSDSFLVFVLLIITAISLFLGILNLLLLRQLSAKIRKVRSLSSAPKYEIGDEISVGKPDVEKVGKLPGGGSGFHEGMSAIAEKYQLDSLIVASKDGLVVASTGSSDPEFEAAHYADLISRKVTIPDENVHLIEFSYSGMPLIGIIRTHNHVTGEIEQRLKEDIRAGFDSQLLQGAEAFGEII